ncbi:A24 family peptidase [Massilia cavernae]|uniref:Prepilin peptidase n=1 Tax=Massilia cavernae TaxID=2320864 RepID=A0A418Y8R3_9BURK|nr:A24 family peptidase [Massilia cavernae]RJG28095.1 prepilin peptidase [Massilia cavernae]
MPPIFHFTDTTQLSLVALVVMLVLATTFDVREHRIPNWLVATGATLAVAYHAISPSGEGAIFALTGMAVGTFALMPLYVFRTMGAGDVKLMGMVGAYLGTPAILSTVLATLIAGGVLALLASTCKRTLPQLVCNLRTMIVQRHIRQMGGAAAGDTQPTESVGKLPYAVAIAAGTACQIFWLRT